MSQIISEEKQRAVLYIKWVCWDENRSMDNARSIIPQG